MASKIIDAISRAAGNQPGNQAELLKLVTYIPAITEKFLPLAMDSNSASNENEEAASETFKAMAKENADLLKHLLHLDFETGTSCNGRSQRVCEVLENLILLGGCEFAKKKFMDVLSHETYTLIQEDIEYFEDLSQSLNAIQQNITCSVSKLKRLALTAIEALFLCDQLKLSPDEQINIVSNMILEKLSTELLTVVDSMKEALQKPSTPLRRSSRGFFSTQLSDSSSDAYLSSSHLLSLANIIDCFLDLENALRECDCSKLQKMQTKSEQFKKSNLKQRSKLPDILRSSQEASWIRSAHIFGDWDWQEVLKDIGPVIVTSLAKAFDECQTSELSTARKSFCAEESGTDEVAKSVSSSILSGSAVPKKTLRYFISLLELMKSLLPYAVLGSHYRPLSGLTSSYIDECNQVLKTMKSFLSVAVNDFPEKVAVTSLHAILATCEDVCVVLGHCALKIDTEPRMPFQGTLQSYKDMIKSVKSMILQNQTGRIRGCILHDAEGDHFHDPKEFADGESCSHSVTNWKWFLERLWNDLCCCVSEDQSNEIFKEVFLNSLQVLESRYLRCEPSYNRRKQLLIDLPLIISMCQTFLREHRLFTFEGSSPNVTNDSVAITACCDRLRSVMCLVAGPLDVVEKCISSWERFRVKSEKIKELLRGDANTSAAVPPKQISQSGKDSKMLGGCLHALFKDKYALLDHVLSDAFIDNLDEHIRREFLSDIYTVLTSCSFLKSDAFFHCSMNSINKNPQMLLKCFLPKVSGTFTYVWQKFIFTQLGKILCPSLAPAVAFLFHPTWSSLALNVIASDTEMKDVVNLSSPNKTNDGEGHFMASIILIIQSLAHATYQLPDWLVTAFVCTQSTLPTMSGIIYGNVLLHVLITATLKFLDEPSLWEQFYYMEFTNEGIKVMQQASSYLTKVCKKDFKPMNTLEDTMKSHLMSLEQDVISYMGSVQNPSYGYTDFQLLQECHRHVGNMMAGDRDGMDSLRKVTNLLSSEIGGSPCKTTGFQFLQDSAHSNLTSMGKTVMEFNWEEMCKTALGTLDWESVRTLLLHRWEMKEGASLKNEEAEIVARISTHFLCGAADSK